MNIERIKQLDTTRYWGFVEAFYPNYHSSEIIAECDDLQKLIDDEFDDDSDAHFILHDRYDGDIENPEIYRDYRDAHYDVYLQSIAAFMGAVHRGEIFLEDEPPISMRGSELPKGAEFTSERTCIINGEEYTWQGEKCKWVRSTLTG